MRRQARDGFHRQPVTGKQRRNADRYTLPAPIRGLILNENLAAAKPGGALILDNWFPTEQGARVRKGSSKFATIGENPVASMFGYKSGTRDLLFAADEGSIFDISAVADVDVAPSPDVIGQSSGHYSTASITNANGDEFMYAVNGEDTELLFDGTDWWRIDDEVTYGLAYDTETGAFTQGETVTGGSSGATATIVSIDDQGTTGTLYVKGVIGGPFQDDDLLTDGDTGVATANIPTGVTTAQSIVLYGSAGSIAWPTGKILHVLSYGGRLYFIEKESMRVWFLPVQSLGAQFGTTSGSGVLNLSAYFKNGGSLLTAGVWSLDSGDGLDDKLVFFTTEGEAAVFSITDPASSSGINPQGRYDISPLMGRNALMQVAGDLLIATEGGIFGLSAVVAKDPGALEISAVTRAIRPAWKSDVSTRATYPWWVLKWPTNNMGIITSPGDSTQEPFVRVVNLQTGAWCRFPGWDARCLTLYKSWGYFGTSAGTVMKCEDGGSDDGAPYYCTYLGQFDHFRNIAVSKTVNMARSTFRSAQPFTANISVATDYRDTVPAAPSAATSISTSLWDVAQWDVAKWDGGLATTVMTKWRSIGRTGFAFAPIVQVTCGAQQAPDAELVAIDFMYEDGGVVV